MHNMKNYNVSNLGFYVTVDEKYRKMHQTQKEIFSKFFFPMQEDKYKDTDFKSAKSLTFSPLNDCLTVTFSNCALV